MSKRVFAFHAHPDDIEFMMAGTLVKLRKLGCEIHYMTLANGSAGTAEYNKADIIRIRAEESQEAADILGAEYHPSLVDDMCVFYDEQTLRRLTAVMRRVKPDIVLLPSPQDYMEDHMNTSRLGVSAAFARGMMNFYSEPPMEPTDQEVAVYHAQPHTSRDALRNLVHPEIYVDVSEEMEDKAQALSCHRSQKDWLDRTQGFGSYVQSMKEMIQEIGVMSGKFTYCEGWRRHSHLGFSRTEINPLVEILGDYAFEPGSGST